MGVSTAYSKTTINTEANSQPIKKNIYRKMKSALPQIDDEGKG